jgi:hypothetical protein
MKKYGELINSWDDFSSSHKLHKPHKEQNDGVQQHTGGVIKQHTMLSPIYDAFIRYFDDPILTKMRDTDTLSIYMCKTYCLLGTAYRYIVLLAVSDTNTLGITKRMSEISNWVSIQTRTLEDNHDLKIHNYQAKRGSLLDAEIIRHSITDNASTYRCTKITNISVTLLHRKDFDPLAYASKGTIISALETFNTIVAFESSNV